MNFLCKQLRWHWFVISKCIVLPFIKQIGNRSLCVSRKQHIAITKPTVHYIMLFILIGWSNKFSNKILSVISFLSNLLATETSKTMGYWKRDVCSWTESYGIYVYMVQNQTRVLLNEQSSQKPGLLTFPVAWITLFYYSYIVLGLPYNDWNILAIF